MSHAIEQLIKLHDAQAVSIESFGSGRGKGILTKEQQIAAFAAAQRSCPAGFDILLVRYRQDRAAEFRIHQHIDAWSSKSNLPFARNAAILAFSATIGRTLPSQHQHIASLLRRHSRRGQQARRLIDACNDTLREMIRRGGDPDYVQLQRQRADEIRAGLRQWSEREAVTTAVCPRCSGTGAVKAGSNCSECAGSGRISSGSDDIYRSMKDCGIGRDEFNSHYVPLINSCINWLNLMESEASDILTRRIKAELRGAA